MRRASVFSVVLGLCLTAAAVLSAPVYTILHQFGDPAVPNDGVAPWGQVVSDGNKLYCMTISGGTNGAGIILSMNSDGSGYTKLHEFPDPAIASDGIAPYGSLIVDGGVLYGMTVAGGTNAGGIIFSINSNGTGYAKLHNFLDPAVANDGASPYGTLAIENGVLYGATIGGGAHGGGILFSITSSGSGYTKLHDFLDPAVVNDGGAPWAGPFLSGDILYGTTLAGGTVGAGTVYSIGKGGAGYTKLHNFPDPAITRDGTTPFSGVIVQDGKIYGTTVAGGEGWAGLNYNGTIFSMNTDGSGYAILHDFTTGGSDGANPYGGVTLVDDRLYGMTSCGGAYGAAPGNGAMYSVRVDGSDFTIERSFAGQPSDGQNPYGDLTLQGSTLYGMTFNGGAYGAAPGNGIVFSYALPTPTPLIDLSVNKNTFSRPDRIIATANVAASASAFYPYVQLVMPGGATGYFVRGRGLVMNQKTPYLSGGPFLLRQPISNYPVINTGFANVATGNYLLNAFGEDIFGTVVGSVDPNNLVVQ